MSENGTRIYVDVHVVPAVGKRVTMDDLRDFLDRWEAEQHRDAPPSWLAKFGEVMPVAEFDSQGRMLQIRARLPGMPS